VLVLNSFKIGLRTKNTTYNRMHSIKIFSFDAEDKGDMLLQNITLSLNCMALQPILITMRTWDPTSRYSDLILTGDMTSLNLLHRRKTSLTYTCLFLIYYFWDDYTSAFTFCGSVMWPYGLSYWFLLHVQKDYVVTDFYNVSEIYSKFNYVIKLSLCLTN
jgi:hypothetical protein